MQKNTWNKIKERSKELEQGNVEKMNHLDKEIRKKIREDKMEYLLEQFRENKEDRHENICGKQLRT